MGDEKPKKTKKKEKKEAEGAPAEEAAPEQGAEAEALQETADSPVQESVSPPPPPLQESVPNSNASSKKKRSSKRPMKGGSNVFDNFSPEEVNEFKAAFQFIDMDKDGIISKDDVRSCYDSIGRVSDEKELEAMMNEASGPINFTQLLTMFFNRMTGSGEVDQESTIQNAFRCYADRKGMCDAMKFREILTSGDDKFSDQEADQALGEMDIENGQVDIEALILKLTGCGGDE